MYNISDYDFFDLGAKKGGSIDFALKRLGGKKGLGIDIKKKNVLLTRKNGYDCLHGDATKLDFPDNSFRFVVMSHFLEHLPDLNTVEKVIKNCSRISKDFLFIQGPFFDADEYLKKQGLKLYWSDFSGHPTHLDSSDFISILKNIGLKKYTIKVKKPIDNSFNPAIHPISSPQDQHEYENGKHPRKEFVKFEKPVFQELICYVQLRKLKNWNDILLAKKSAITYIESPLLLNFLQRFLYKTFGFFPSRAFNDYK